MSNLRQMMSGLNGMYSIKAMIFYTFIVMTLSGCGSIGYKGAAIQQQAFMAGLDRQLSALSAQQKQTADKVDAMVLSQVALSEQAEGVGDQLSKLHHLLHKHDTAEPGELSDDKKASQVPKSRLFESQHYADKLLLGRVEWLWMEPLSHYLKAKVDSGTSFSTLSVDKFMEFERNGEKWIRFSVSLSVDEQVKVKVVEKPLLKYIKNKSSTSSVVQKKPVVLFVTAIGGQLEEFEFILTVNPGTTYPAVLGRNFLTDIAVVDVAKKFVYARNEKLMGVSKREFAKLETPKP